MGALLLVEWMRVLAILFALLTTPLLADVTGCACDPARPQTLAARECALCGETEKQPADVPVFFLKDINPRKPNRWLALPRSHGKAQHSLADLPAPERARLWTAAIEKARSLFGGRWGLAINGDEVRTLSRAYSSRPPY